MKMIGLAKMGLRRRLGLALAFGLLATCTVVALARPAEAELRLRLEASAKEYLMGEPVSLKVTLENPSSKPEQTTGLLNPLFGNLLLYISPDGKNFLKYLGPDWSVADVFARLRPLKPGEKKSHEFDVLWNHPIRGVADHIFGELAFPQPGRYWLRAQLLDKDQTHDSNTIEVSIKNPSGDDSAVWEAMKANPRLALFIQYPTPEVRPEDLKQLKALLKKYPEGTYAPYIRKALKESKKMEEAKP